MAGLGIIAGPVVGGWLLEHFWWGSVFLVNVPIVGVALLFGLPLVPESKDPNATPLDPVGAFLSIAGLTALVYGIIEAPENGWGDPLTLWAFGIAAVLLVVFGAWELRTPHPMLRMSFFRNPRFSAGSLSITLIFFALFGSIFVLTQHLQFVLGYSALEAGLRVTPIATLVVAAPIAARVVERIGTKVVVAAGLTIAATGLMLIANADIGDGYAPIGWSLAVIGIGMGATMAPATDAIMGSLPLAKAGVGSAMNDTTRMVGGALGVAVIGSALSSSYGSAVEPALGQLPRPAAAAAGDSVGAALEVARRAGPAAGDLVQAARSAFIDGMGDAVLVAAGVAAAGALLVLLFLPFRPRRATFEVPLGLAAAGITVAALAAYLEATDEADPGLRAAAAALVEDGDMSEEERARVAAREVLRPLALRALRAAGESPGATREVSQVG